MDYKEKLRLAKEALESGSYDRETIEYIFPELKESENERIRGAIIEHLKDNDLIEWAAWLKKQGEQKQDPCEKCDHFTLNCHNFPCIKKKAFDQGKSALETIKEEKVAWSEEDETALADALWCCKQAASIAKDENDMGNIWYTERWLKSIKERVKPQWKPSEEQMQVLIWCLPLFADPKLKEILKSLIDELKKL